MTKPDLWRCLKFGKQIPADDWIKHMEECTAMAGEETATKRKDDQ